MSAVADFEKNSDEDLKMFCTFMKDASSQVCGLFKLGISKVCHSEGGKNLNKKLFKVNQNKDSPDGSIRSHQRDRQTN